MQRAATQFGDAEIWTARAPTALTNVTVSSTQSSAGVHQSLTVVAFSGVGGVGASNTAAPAPARPRSSLTTTAAGSVVYAVGNDWDRAVARTIPAGQTKVHEFVDTAVGDTFWVQAASGTIAAAGSTVTLNATAPASDQWNLAIVELTPGRGAGPVTVPNVVGLTQAAAQTAITSAGLTVGAITTRNSATVPAGPGDQPDAGAGRERRAGQRRRAGRVSLGRRARPDPPSTRRSSRTAPARARRRPSARRRPARCCWRSPHRTGRRPAPTPRR